MTCPVESNSEYVLSLRASNSRGLGPAVYATVRTRAAADDDDEPDDDEDDEEEDEPPPLIPPVGVKVRGGEFPGAVAGSKQSEFQVKSPSIVFGQSCEDHAVCQGSHECKSDSYTPGIR